LPRETTLIGFAGAPWTVATYMIAGRGTPDQGPAHKLRQEDPDTFGGLIDLLTDATIGYLDAQVQAGAEVVKVFDSWAGSLKGDAFRQFALEPAKRITAELKRRHPGLPVIVFPREAGENYTGFAKATGADCIAIDTKVDPAWAAEHLQPDGCVQGNLDPRHMVTGGQALVDETRRIVEALKGGPHIFNLGHGITPEADPENVHLLLETIRG
jgi:uroporphyrinogen decarboxylase